MLSFLSEKIFHLVSHSTMDATISKAKSLFKDKKYLQSEKLLLQIINEDRHNRNNYILYSKLGDIARELGNYITANKYYQQSLMLDDLNPTIFLKLGDLLHYHLENYQQSEEMYIQCLKLNHQNSKCHFQLGKLMILNNKLAEAEASFRECLKLDASKASPHYYLSIVLIKQNKHEQKTILYGFLRAIHLQPLIAKYSIEFAKYCEKIGRKHQANYSYKKALELTNDPSLLEIYAYFLLNQMNDIENALKYLKKACELDDEYEYDYDCLREDVLLQNRCEYNIKLILYDFESIILYRQPNQMIDDLNMTDLKGIFGGNDRITKLKDFLQKSVDKNVKNIIFGKDTCDNIYKLLKPLGLYEYVNEIIGNDTSHFLTQNKEKIYHIIKIKDDNKLRSSNEILHISGIYEDIINASNECKTYFVDPTKSYPFSGPNLYDFYQLHHVIDDPQFMVNNDVDQNFVFGTSITNLKRKNEPLLKALINETIAYCKYNKRIHSLETLYELQQKDHEYFEFSKFFHDFSQAMRCIDRDNLWTAGYYLQCILKNEQSQIEIWRRFARCCSYLKHNDAANIAYDISLNINPYHYYTNFSFSYHLLMCGDYKRSKEAFIRTNNVSKFASMNASLLVGLARTCEELGQYDEADKYYKDAVKDSYIKYYEPAHYYYGCFLERTQRFSKAMDQFDICFKMSPNKCQNILKICEVSLNLNDMKKFEFFIKKAIQMDPSVIYNYERHYKKSYVVYNGKCLNSDQINILDVNHDAEFDSFWFDEIAVTIPEFNAYYDHFIRNNLNDMSLLLGDNDIARKLNEIIKIKDPIHFDLILSKITHRRFVEKM